MKTLLFVLIAASAVRAEMSDEDKASLIKLTADIVTEKHDDFDRKVTVSYSGPEISLNGGAKVKAYVTWPDGDLQKTTFLLSVTRVEEGWRWLKFSETKMLAEGELVNLIDRDLETDVFDGGDVYEAKYVELTLEQVLRVISAEEVKMRIGIDEWTWTDQHKIPLQVVLSRWMGRGGDTSAYKDLMRLISRPTKGDAFAVVVKRYGEPISRDAASGWADWQGFRARFKDGKVIDTQARRVK